MRSQDCVIVVFIKYKLKKEKNVEILPSFWFDKTELLELQVYCYLTQKEHLTWARFKESDSIIVILFILLQYQF